MEQGLHPCLISFVPTGLILGFCAISYIIAVVFVGVKEVLEVPK
jgi:hypothetical protein